MVFVGLMYSTPGLYTSCDGTAADTTTTLTIIDDSGTLNDNVQFHSCALRCATYCTNIQMKNAMMWRRDFTDKMCSANDENYIAFHHFINSNDIDRQC